MGVSDVCGSVMASEEAGSSWGGDTCTPVAGIGSSPFSACWKRSMCLAEGSVCDSQDFSCSQPGVKHDKFSEGWREGLEGEASQGLQACSHTALLLGLKRKANKPVGLIGENRGT